MMIVYTEDWGLETVYHESWYRDSELNFLEVCVQYMSGDVMEVRSGCILYTIHTPYYMS